MQVGQAGHNLSEHVADQGLCDSRALFYELKQVETVSVFLHYQLEIVLVFICFQ